MIDVGWLGSPIDVATFLFVLATFVHEIRPRVDKTAAAVVALAQDVRNVDHEHLAAELEVDARDVAAVRPTIVADGGERGGGPAS